MSTDTKKKWYKTWWGILAIIFLFPIFLLIFASKLIWKQKWDKKVRIGLVAALWGGVIIFGMLSRDTPRSTAVSTGCVGPDGKKVNLTQVECEKFNNAWKNGQQSTQVDNNPQPTAAPTNTPKPAEKHNVVVISQIVKKVNGKHRYFFDIRNKDTKPFEGTVTISLFTSKLPNAIAGDTFNTTKPIEPELGTSVYTDASTGPPSVHGENGISKFKYTVKKGDTVVHSGEGVITEKFEDVDAYGL